MVSQQQERITSTGASMTTAIVVLLVPVQGHPTRPQSNCHAAPGRVGPVFNRLPICVRPPCVFLAGLRILCFQGDAPPSHERDPFFPCPFDFPVSDLTSPLPVPDVPWQWLSVPDHKLDWTLWSLFSVGSLSPYTHALRTTNSQFP